MIIIGLAGPPCAGKATVARYLIDRHHFGRAYPGTLAALCLAFNARAVFQNVLYDDTAELIRANGQIWLIQRPGYLTRAGDAYKGITPAAADRGLLNDGPIQALYNRVDRLLDDLQDQARK